VGEGMGTTADIGPRYHAPHRLCTIYQRLTTCTHYGMPMPRYHVFRPPRAARSDSVSLRVARRPSRGEGWVSHRLPVCTEHEFFPDLGTRFAQGGDSSCVPRQEASLTTRSRKSGSKPEVALTGQEYGRSTLVQHELGKLTACLCDSRWSKLIGDAQSTAGSAGNRGSNRGHRPPN
jgi:hypothetical protein